MAEPNKSSSQYLKKEGLSRWLPIVKKEMRHPPQRNSIHFPPVASLEDAVYAHSQKVNFSKFTTRQAAQRTVYYSQPKKLKPSEQQFKSPHMSTLQVADLLDGKDEWVIYSNRRDKEGSSEENT